MNRRRLEVPAKASALQALDALRQHLKPITAKANANARGKLRRIQSTRQAKSLQDFVSDR